MTEEITGFHLELASIGFVILNLPISYILVASKDKDMVEVTEGWFSSTFNKKDMGIVTYK